MNTILFDLDGTLLPMDVDRFMHDYMKALTESFLPHMDPNHFQQRLWAGTHQMLQNKGHGLSNEMVFYQTFFEEGDPIDRSVILQVFEDFYKGSFELARKATEKNRYMIEAVQSLKNKGYRMAVATNPLFPRYAVERRIHWAGLQPEDFELITSFETMHACKPHLAFYREVLEKMDIQPDEAMMVGNDEREDLAAGELGIRTYLVTDCLLPSERRPYEPDYKGSSQEFGIFVKELPDLG